MKKLLLLTLTVLSNICLGQLKSVVIDKQTKEVIPYVNIWIEGKHAGTTSNQLGEFEINMDGSEMLVFSAMGYENKQ